MASLILIIFVTSTLLVIAFITILNVLTMLRLGKAPHSEEKPFISVLIPARNEADVIATTVKNLLAQSYPNFELILLDDNSTDGTQTITQQAANGDKRLTIISGKLLPEDWAGKNWACHQLSQQAQGEWLIFTDADVKWSTNGLQSVVDMMHYSHADLLTVWSTQHTETWGERLIVPLMAFVTLGYLPHLAVSHIPLAAFAAANGQCMAFRRSAYEAIGGHVSVRNTIVEDIRLAQKIKQKGLNLRMVDGAGVINCHMYHGWQEVRNGYAKNIIAGYGDSILGLLAGTLFHWFVFLFPYLWMIISIFNQNWLNTLWALLLILIVDLIRAITAAATHQRLIDALLMPISVLLMTRIAIHGVWWYWRYGGPRWKDRTIIRKNTGKNMTKQAVIIGAGIGGLTTAIRLAAQGWRVQIYEQNEKVGGKMNEIRADGFRWDTGPSVITMRHVFEELFTSVGRNLEDYITLLPVDPLTRYFYPDGVILDATSDISQMGKQIAEINERDIEGYLRYLSYAARIHRITGPVFIYNDPPKIWDILSVPPHEMPAVDPLRKMNQAIESFVQSPHMRQLLGRFATYTGASPYRAPATLNVIAHVELTGGVWYPQGGIYAIAAALEKLACELGVEIHTGCPVEQIQVKNDIATGITLQRGQFVSADVVIANFDVALVYENLLPSEIATLERMKQLTDSEPSCSGFIMMLGVERNHQQLVHHNIFFSSDYPAEFKAIFERGVPPEDPTIYVAITGKTDPEHAPNGCENWFVLVNAPPLGDSYDWQQNTQMYRNLVLDKLANYGYDIQDKIRTERILTPIDLEKLTGARRGALYGASSNSKWTAFRRPHNRAKDVKGLYFTGGTTHPGGGVPMVMLSGKVAARMVLEDNI